MPPKKSTEIKYLFFNEEQQLQQRKQTLAQIEQEHYANTLQLERAKASGQETAHLESALAALVSQHEALSQTLPSDPKE